MPGSSQCVLSVIRMIVEYQDQSYLAIKNEKNYQWDGLSLTRIDNTRSETEEESEGQEKEFDQDRGTKKLSNL